MNRGKIISRVVSPEFMADTDGSNRLSAPGLEPGLLFTDSLFQGRNPA
jgi:hypothetical protein